MSAWGRRRHASLNANARNDDRCAGEGKNDFERRASESLTPAFGRRRTICRRRRRTPARSSLGASVKRPGFWAVPQFFEHLLSDFQNLRHTVLGGKTEAAVNEAVWLAGQFPAPAKPAMETARSAKREGRSAKKKRPWGRRKSLKRLDPDKENKVNSFDCLWPGFAGFGQFWLNSAWLGFSLDRPGRVWHGAEAPCSEFDDRGDGEGQNDSKGARRSDWRRLVGGGEPFAGAEGERRLRDRRGQSPGRARNWPRCSESLKCRKGSRIIARCSTRFPWMAW